MTVQLNRMYDEFAHLWPLISPPEDYAAVACYWLGALRAKLGPGRHHLLELGVGGGNNLSHLAAEFDATAVDLSPKMLAHSKRLNPGVEHHVGDMRSIRLDKVFDAVLVHDAITCLTSEDDLRAVFATARAHLRTGGVFIASPDYFREAFRPSQTVHGPRRRGGTELTYVEYVHDPDPDDTVVEAVYVYFIKTDGSLRVEVDRHLLGLFPLTLRW